MSTPVLKVSGVGPKAAERLAEADITTAEQLAAASIEKLVEVGLTAKRAEKFITAAGLLLGTAPEEKPKKKAKKEKKVEETPVEEKPKKKAKKEKKVEEAPVEEKPKKKAKKEKKVEEAPVEEKPKKKTKKKEVREDQRSPVPKGIPTKKKRGIQVRAVDDEDREFTRVEKEVGWKVDARELTEEEKEEKRIRLEMMNLKAKITRPIPSKPEPVKAVKAKKKAKSEKPVKQEKVKKEIKKVKKKSKKTIEYFDTELYPVKTGARRRGVTAKSTGESKPRIKLERDTLIGEISSHRRSRRVIHPHQVIVELDDDLDASPDTLVGQKVYFVFPDTGKKMAGSIAKRFGKKSTRKVLVYFKKGVRAEGLHQKLLIK